MLNNLSDNTHIKLTEAAKKKQLGLLLMKAAVNYGDEKEFINKVQEELNRIKADILNR